MRKYFVSHGIFGDLKIMPIQSEYLDGTNYYMYEEQESENMTGVEFLNDIFSNNDSKIVRSVQIINDLKDDSIMTADFGEDGSKMTDMSEYVGVEVENFYHGKRRYSDEMYAINDKDIYYFKKSEFYRKNSIAFRLISMASNLANDKKSIDARINGIRREYANTNRLLREGNAIVEEYFDNGEVISDESRKELPDYDFNKYFVEHRDNMNEIVDRRWDVSRKMKFIDGVVTGSFVVGGVLSSLASSITVDSATITPLILGCGFAVLGHVGLREGRLKLVDSKSGRIHDEYVYGDLKKLIKK